MQINIANFIVRNSDGSLDLQGTLDALAPEVIAAVEKTDNQFADIANAVHAVFDQFKGIRLSTDSLVSFAMRNMEVSIETVSDTAGRIKDYVKANTGERGVSLFSTKRGKGGGIQRWSDVTDD